jgi:hypothetical protein
MQIYGPNEISKRDISKTYSYDGNLITSISMMKCMNTALIRVVRPVLYEEYGWRQAELTYGRNGRDGMEGGFNAKQSNVH